MKIQATMIEYLVSDFSEVIYVDKKDKEEQYKQISFSVHLSSVILYMGVSNLRFYSDYLFRE
jgi:hypothetical protein